MFATHRATPKASRSSIGGRRLLAGVAMLVLGVAAAAVGGTADDQIEPDADLPDGQIEIADSMVYVWVFGNGSEPVSAKRHLDSLLDQKLASIDQICHLTHAQKQKLDLTGRGDIKRFINRIDEIGTQYQRAQNDPKKLVALTEEATRLQRDLKSGLFRDGSFFFRSVEKNLTPEQFVRYEPLRAVFRVGGSVQTHERGAGVVLEVVLSGTAIADDDLAALSKLPNLQRLGLDNTQVTDAGLAHLSQSPSLVWLWLGKTRVTDAGLTHLQGLTTLQGLLLGDTQVTDAGLAHLTGLTNLQQLWLSGTPITDAGLAHLTGLKNLRELWLVRTLITDAGLKYLKDLTSLRRLWLGSTQVTDAGLTHLQGLTKMERLDLEGTRVTDAGLARLKALTRLQGLALEDTQGTKEGIADLKQALPRLRPRD